MTATVLWNIHSNVVAAQADVLLAGRARFRLQKLIGIVRLMRIMALHAVAHRRRMDRLPRLHLLLVMTAEAQRLGRRSDQLDPCYVAADPDFVAAQTPGCDRRVNCFSLALIFVALQALRRVDIFLEG